MSNNGSGATAIETIAASNGAVHHGNWRKRAGYWIGAWWPVAAAVALIACESTEYFGADRTTGPFRLVWEFLFGPVGDARWELIHHLVRKTGHFVGYGIVWLSWLRAWRMTLRNSRFLLHAGMALAGSVVMACCDEWHQAYLPNRGSSVWDVLLDCCGALAMMLVAHVWLRK